MSDLKRELIKSNYLKNWFQADVPSALDRQKCLERLLTSQVESSAIAGCRGDHDTALIYARKAQETFESLRVSQAQDLRCESAISGGSSPDEGTVEHSNPITTACNLFELLLMVKSNLAIQLGRSNRDEEALEIFTQLGRLASSSSNNLGGFSIASGQLEEMRLILFKFGLEVGNSLFKMGDYQRALKYYRLTLDRLPSSKYQNLRIKIMSNISIAVAKLYWLGSETSKASDKPSTSAYLNSTRLLLADNVKQQEQKDNLAKVSNANHHRFGLNLIVAQLESSDLRGSLKTLESLIGIDLHEHFVRLNKDRATHPPDLQAEEFWSKLLTKTKTGPIRKTSRIGSGSSSSSASSSTSTASKKTIIRDYEPIKMDGDTLNSDIDKREEQVRRALVLGCALVSDQDIRMRASNRSEELELILLELEQESLFSYCLSLLERSSRYSSIKYELLMDRALNLLFHCEDCFQRGVEMLNRVKLAVQQEKRQRESNATKERVQLMDSGFITSKPTAQTGQLTEQQQQQQLIESIHVQANISVINTLLGPTQDNHALVEALNRQPANASSWVNLAHYYQKQSKEPDLNYAALCLKQALLINPLHWHANYNSMILTRVHGSKASSELYGVRSAPSMASLLTENHFQPLLNSLLYRGLLLEIVQSLANSVILQKVRREKVLNLIKSIINTQHCVSPELALMLSRLLGSELNNVEQKDATTTPSPMSMLISALKIHPYHVALMERIIAYYISSFDYNSAEQLIEVCAKLRPDQAKWHRMLAECCQRESDYQRAMAIYRRAASRFPFDVGCLRAMTKLAKDLGLSKEYLDCQAKLDNLQKWHIST